MTDQAITGKVSLELPGEVNRSDGLPAGESLCGITPTIPSGTI